eukprot:scaffold1038_cov274-Prasinococcus_capsulatus_cf.AAC.1
MVGALAAHARCHGVGPSSCTDLHARGAAVADVALLETAAAGGAGARLPERGGLALGQACCPHARQHAPRRARGRCASAGNH